jgi:hypothetical protein
VYRVFGRPCISQHRLQRLNPHQGQRRGALWDSLRGNTFKEERNVFGILKDNETAGKKKARQATIRKGRANLFDSHPDTEKLLPLSKHIKDRIPLRPQSGRPWYKTYKIREQVSGSCGSILYLCVTYSSFYFLWCCFSVSCVLCEHANRSRPGHPNFTSVTENSTTWQIR